MSLEVERKVTVLKGEPTMAMSSASFKSVMKAIGNEKVGFLIECNILQQQQQGSKCEVPPVVTIVFKDFEEVFQESESLPPSRKHDHIITLKERADIPNLRPKLTQWRSIYCI